MLIIRREQLAAMAQAVGQPVVMPCGMAWVEVQILDMENKPVPGVCYEIRLPGGRVVNGYTDSKGLARYDRILPGQCEICLPDFDRDAWVQL